MHPQIQRKTLPSAPFSSHREILEACCPVVQALSVPSFSSASLKTACDSACQMTIWTLVHLGQVSRDSYLLEYRYRTERISLLNRCTRNDSGSLRLDNRNLDNFHGFFKLGTFLRSLIRVFWTVTLQGWLEMRLQNLRQVGVVGSRHCVYEAVELSRERDEVLFSCDRLERDVKERGD